MNDRTEINEIRRLIAQETIWLRDYNGRVVDMNDPSGKGRAKVVIPDLSLDAFGGATWFWCWPRDKNSMSPPKVGDWLAVRFLNGDRNRPFFWGKANEMKDMVPESFDGSPTTHVLFEDPAEPGAHLIHVKFDAAANVLEVGNQKFAAAARVGDNALSNVSIDPAFWAVFIAFLAVVMGTVVNEPGAGNPSAFQTALKAAMLAAGATVSAPSSMTSQIMQGSDQVKIGGK